MLLEACTPLSWCLGRSISGFRHRSEERIPAIGVLPGQVLDTAQQTQAVPQNPWARDSMSTRWPLVYDLEFGLVQHEAVVTGLRWDNRSERKRSWEGHMDHGWRTGLCSNGRDWGRGQGWGATCLSPVYFRLCSDGKTLYPGKGPFDGSFANIKTI
jgi:hypothetical protein